MKYIIIFALLALMLTACTQEIVQQQPMPNEEKEYINAMQDAQKQSSDVTIKLTGTNYAFWDEQGNEAPTLRVKQGDTITILFESKDGFHDWKVDEFNAATQKVNPGTPTSITFTADQKGEFEYYCSVGKHREQGMVGKLIVE